MDTQSQRQPARSSTGDEGMARSEFLRNKAIVNAIGEAAAKATRRYGVTRQ